MEIQIKTQFNEVTVDHADLSPDERRALAGLLGMSSKRKEIFEILRDVPRFRKIRDQDVFALCPRFARFPLEFEIERAEDTEWGQQALALMRELVPDADLAVKVRRLRGFCPKCQHHHQVERRTISVSLVVETVRFTNIYEA
jgi:hypothetical protein